jgi:hypothetical protein
MEIPAADLRPLMRKWTAVPSPGLLCNNARGGDVGCVGSDGRVLQAHQWRNPQW